MSTHVSLRYLCLLRGRLSVFVVMIHTFIGITVWSSTVDDLFATAEHQSDSQTHSPLSFYLCRNLFANFFPLFSVAISLSDSESCERRVIVSIEWAVCVCGGVVGDWAMRTTITRAVLDPRMGSVTIFNKIINATFWFHQHTPFTPLPRSILLTFV